MLDFIFCQGHSGRIRAQKPKQTVLAMWFPNETDHVSSGGKNSRSLSNGTYYSWSETQRVIMALLLAMRMRSSGFCLTDNPYYTLYYERIMKLAWRNSQICYDTALHLVIISSRGEGLVLVCSPFSTFKRLWMDPDPFRTSWNEAERGQLCHRLKTDRWITQGLLRVLHQIHYETLEKWVQRLGQV